MENRFHNILLPDFIAFYLRGETVFHTSIASTISGKELRILDRKSASQKYKACNCRLSNKEFYELSSFFRARNGNYYSFLMRDHSDYRIVNQKLDRYCIKNNIFKIYKSYPDFVAPYKRRVKNIRRKNFSLNIEFKYVDFDEGIIYMEDNFNYSTQTVEINCEFDLRVRFLHPQLSYKRWEDNSILIENMEIIEL